MADIGRQLFIKYGLRSRPSEQTAKQWAQQVESLIWHGFSPETAGDIVAKSLFPDYNTAVYASEADSIEALLAAAAERAQRGS